MKFLIFACALLSTIHFAVAADSPPRPNILYLYVDDMGWGSLGPNAQFARKEAGKHYVKTPNLDKLAARGVNFTRAYGCTVCSPARSSQQTGFHQGHTFADRNDPDNAKKAIRADDITMGDALAKAGYTTGYWGKWGYGGSKDQRNPTIDNIQTLPTSHGYKHVVAELHHVRAHTFFQPTLWSAPAAEGLKLIPNSMEKYTNNSLYPDQPSKQNHPDYPETAYCDDVYCFAALDFVRAGANAYNQNGTPFFGLLAVQVPHAPFNEIMKLPDWDADYREMPGFSELSDQTRQWAAMVTRIDGHFGNLFAALEDPNGDGDTADSIADNTLIIFQSDNGGPGGPANKELDTNGGLRGTKGKIHEGGIRIPMLMSWPSMIHTNAEWKPGTSSDRIIDVSDLLPTFCELAGEAPPLGIDGVSFAPDLLGIPGQRKREFLIHEAGNFQSIIRGNHKLIRSKKGLELYDLKSDHGEGHDIAAANKDLVAELEELMLGERVDEPRGFANTYHTWTGKNNASTSAAENWSDYKYENAGITYLEDNGSPQVSWIAEMHNKSAVDNKAVADADIAFLGLEIRGESAKQELHLQKGINLTARNELRLSGNAVLSVDGGTVKSLRWVDIAPGAKISGNGKIDATVYNQGILEISGSPSNSQFLVDGDYHGKSTSTLRVSKSFLVVSGTATLSGKLEFPETLEGNEYSVLNAHKITGKFSNPNDEVKSRDGRIFKIHYSSTAVTIKFSPRPKS